MATSPVRVEGSVLTVGIHQFCTMPEAVPGGTSAAHDKQSFVLPAGWRVVSRTDSDFDAVTEMVIAKYGFASRELAVRHEEDVEKFSSFYTANPRPSWELHASPPGSMSHETDQWVKVLTSWRFKINDSNTRLLLRRVQVCRHSLL